MELMMEDYEEELQSYGYYLLKNEEDEIRPYSSNNDVSISKPIIMAKSTGEWLVSGGGSWTTETWRSHGSYGNIGSPDAVGIAFSDQYGTYRATVTGLYAYFGDGEGREVETDSTSTPSGRNGAVFSLQDSYYGIASVGTFIGKHFGCSVTYSSDFMYYHGNACTFYAHTWNSTVIESINLNISTAPGVSITFSSSNNRLVAYSAQKDF